MKYRNPKEMSLLVLFTAMFFPLLFGIMSLIGSRNPMLNKRYRRIRKF
ncbi:hypothetical protein SAMN05421544_10724 [Riemerella columbipharyngis]|uniref:Uncharacterized protein n=1 Tax=Riemerella columbipharyngis TaxID=1071918 RepID=A0A1G7C1A4_9FLAO|nr:hypothetical protein SAMN05421544_10724 [Riemerella columbipharyngis]